MGKQEATFIYNLNVKIIINNGINPYLIKFSNQTQMKGNVKNCDTAWI